MVVHEISSAYLSMYSMTVPTMVDHVSSTMVECCPTMVGYENEMHCEHVLSDVHHIGMLIYYVSFVYVLNNGWGEKSFCDMKSPDFARVLVHSPCCSFPS
jgi:hypothetical protein